VQGLVEETVVMEEYAVLTIFFFLVLVAYVTSMMQKVLVNSG